MNSWKFYAFIAVFSAAGTQVAQRYMSMWQLLAALAALAPLIAGLNLFLDRFIQKHRRRTAALFLSMSPAQQKAFLQSLKEEDRERILSAAKEFAPSQNDIRGKSNES